ncbi:unnamed protein product [Nippostrongylus brasiliensis]|uniref:Transmembrane protein n=1 Tax=Nippostrongylus brasiliensis TaxID=27835 RepID=A0A0N4XGJ0_NIPBR|nr:unnamed protein product [Nippostrongylus brasiliensis]
MWTDGVIFGLNTLTTALTAVVVSRLASTELLTFNGAGPPPIPQQKSVPPTIKTPTATPIPPGYLASPMPNQASTVEMRVNKSRRSPSVPPQPPEERQC